MKTRIEKALEEATISTFECICFMYPAPELKDIQKNLKLEAAAEVKYKGNYTGNLLIETRGDLLSAIASRPITVYHYKNLLTTGALSERQAPVDDVLLRPQHPYTLGLLNSIPALHKRGRQLDVIKGVVPNPFRMPAGCKFEPRCPYAWDKCKKDDPDLVAISGREGLSRCFLQDPEAATRRVEFDRAAVATVSGEAR